MKVKTSIVFEDVRGTSGGLTVKGNNNFLSLIPRLATSVQGGQKQVTQRTVVNRWAKMWNGFLESHRQSWNALARDINFESMPLDSAQGNGRELFFQMSTVKFYMGLTNFSQLASGQKFSTVLDPRIDFEGDPLQMLVSSGTDQFFEGDLVKVWAMQPLRVGRSIDIPAFRLLGYFLIDSSLTVNILHSLMDTFNMQKGAVLWAWFGVQLYTSGSLLRSDVEFVKSGLFLSND